MVVLMTDVNTSLATTERINAATVAVLRSVIAVRHLNQRKIAESIGLTPVTVSRYLNGHRDVPLVLVFAVAVAAGVAASELVERIGRELAEPLI